MKSNFQIIVLAVCIGAFIFGILTFSGVIKIGSSSTSSTVPQGSIVVWGVLPQDTMSTYISNFNSGGNGYTAIYQYHDPATFNQDLIVALANNQQPDVVILNSEIFSQFEDKLYVTPYAAYNESAYRTTNVDGAQIFLTSTGVAALPLLVDPLVVYYNKDILAGANFVVPPSSWKILAASVPLFVKRTKTDAISQAAIALGTSTNIAHVRDILSALFLQTGNQIVSLDKTTGKMVPTINTGSTAQALDFYSNFSNPTSAIYTWNTALPNSLDMFLAGKSAFYIGRASELFSIQSQNPNLNFDVTQLFQPDGATRSLTFGSFIGAATLKNAPNPVAAYAFISNLSTSTSVDTLSKNFSLPPAQRALLLVQQSNPYISTFFRAAIAAFAWPDQNMNATEQIFRAMITNVTSGALDTQSALDEAAKDLQTNM